VRVHVERLRRAGLISRERASRAVSLLRDFAPEDPARAACVIEVEGFELE